jgi:hypothetical protein
VRIFSHQDFSAFLALLARRFSLRDLCDFFLAVRLVSWDFAMVALPFKFYLHCSS